METTARKNSFTKNIITAAIIVCVVLMTCCMYAYAASARTDAPARNKVFTSIQIGEGETLTEIADRYMTEEYSSRSEYIREVQQINGFRGDVIYAGAYLIVPYYVD